MPAPTFIGFLAWIIVPTPDTIKAMLIRYGICSPNPRTPPIINVGVMTPTKLASTCCNAAKNFSAGGGSASSSYINSESRVSSLIFILLLLIIDY